MPSVEKSLEFKILGPLEARRGGHLVDLGGAKQRAVLASLLLHANEVVSVDRLIDELWGEAPPQTAANALQVYVSQLRKALEPGAGDSDRVLVTRAPGYLARVSEEQLDLSRFERLVAEGREAMLSSETDLAAELLREGLSLWQGPCLAELSLNSFAHAAIARLEQLRLAAREDLVVVDLALGRHAELVPELEELVAEHPYREPLRGQLMLALYRAGRQADALEAYQQARLLLVEELGIDPSPDLQRLQQAILRQDPALQLAPQPSDAAGHEPPAAGEVERRKTVSVAFVDARAARGADELEPELVSAVAARSFETLSRIVEGHAGVASRLPNGRAMAVFGVPIAHEDDALRAVRALADVREALAALGAELEPALGVALAVRGGVETGVALIGRDHAGELAVTGSVVVTAERACQSADVGEILVGLAARSLVSGAARTESVDGEAAGHFWRLLEVVPGAPAVERRLDTPLVGRADELAELRQALERVAGERRCALVTVLGEAGIGKSRLAHELRTQAAGELTVLSGGCRSYGEGVTFSPIADLLEPSSGIASLLAGDADAERIARVIAGATGTGEPVGTSEEVFRAVRRLLESIAREQPLVVVLDDIHWAEPTFLDLIEHVAEWSREAPILLLCLARPELLEERPSWGGGNVNATTLLLEPLSEADCAALIAQLPGGRELSDELQSRIASFAGGNPFFVEQLLAMLAEDPAFADSLSSPPSVRALLGARLDRLSSGERAVLEHASVIGAEFSRSALVELLPDELRPEADAELERLERKALVHALDAGVGEAGTYVFVHALVRDAAYDSLPKRLRSTLHAQLAEWLEQAAGEQQAELDEIAGYHLEQAYVCRRELGAVDDADRALAERGGARLAAAGRRAYAAGNTPAAVSLLTRAAGLLERDHPARPEIAADLGEALRDAGQLGLAESTLTEAIEAAARIGSDRVEAHALIVRWRMQLQTDPEVSFDEVVTSIGETIDRLDELGDERMLAKAWACLAWVPWLRGQGAACEQALERALAYARSCEDVRTEAQILNFLVGVALFGPMPVEVAIPRCREVLEQAKGEGRIAASALRALAGLHAMEGRFEQAWACIDRDRAILRDLGLRVVVSSSAELAGIVGLLADDPARAESHLRWGYEILDEMGDRSGLSTNAAILAEAVLAQGRDEEALALAAFSMETGAAEDLTVQVQWRGPRAKALARRGEVEEAEQLAREAVALAGRTDFLNLHGNALIDLAKVLRLADRSTDAAAAAEAAATLYEQKGNLVSASKARAVAAELYGASMARA